ncbi:MAG: type II toxin-antitoxin system VapC family toxin [Thermoanaerobaculia bacterium]
MRVLLDTHCWLWLVSEPERLPAALVETLQDPTSKPLLSTVSVWELAIKRSIGRIELPAPVDPWVPEVMATSGVLPLEVHLAHVLRVSRLPLHHRDPFDRLLVAQALEERVPLVTADRQLEGYGAEILWAGPSS